jgi:DNA-damage-inducible protein D
MKENNALTPFAGEGIRKIWHEEQWYFNVSDVIGILTDSKDPKAYWRNLKKRLLQEGNSQSVSNCYGLKFEAADGKKYLQDAANTVGILRIVMSVPSPKAEPLKLWLAEQGKQSLDEAENPELLTERQAELYRAKGYTEEWIGRRVQTIETRKALTDEWKARGVEENQEYSILTATIAKGTFGLTPTEHKEVKGLNRQNLRDNRAPLELIFTALSEEATKMIAVREDAQGFLENHHAATEGGRMAGDARKNFEQNMNESVVSANNYLNLNQGDKASELPKKGE